MSSYASPLPSFALPAPVTQIADSVLENVSNAATAVQAAGAYVGETADSWLDELVFEGERVDADQDLEADDLVAGVNPTGAATWNNEVQALDETGRSTRAESEEASALQHSSALALTLADGKAVLAGEKTVDAGPFKGVLGAAVSATEGLLAGSIGLSKNDGQTDLGATLRGGIDLASDGSIEAASIGGDASVGTTKASAGAGATSKVSEPEKGEDGLYTVRWDAGLGASVDVAAGGASIQGGGALAAVISRTFDTREEADAFRGQVEAGEVKQGPVSAEDALAMDPGEKLENSQTSTSRAGAGLGLAIGAEEAETSSTTVEKLASGNIRVQRKHNTVNQLTLGLGSFLGGVEGSVGTTERDESDVEFDLTKPGAATMYDEFQLTGKLPEELPEGVMLNEAIDTDGVDWGTKSWMLFDTIERNWSTEEGTIREGDLMGGYAKGHSSESHKRSFLGKEREISGESHALEGTGYTDHPTFTQTTTFKGDEAEAKMRAHLDAGVSLDDARQMVKNEAGEFTAATRFAQGATNELGALGAGNLINNTHGNQRMKQLHSFNHQDGGVDEFARDMMTPQVDMGVFTNHVAWEGATGAAFLNYNMSGETTAVSAGGEEEAMGALNAREMAEANLALLEQGGDHDRGQLLHVAESIQVQLDALWSSQNTYRPSTFSSQREELEGQLLRVNELLRAAL